MGELSIAILGGPDHHPGYERVFPKSATQFPGLRDYAAPNSVENTRLCYLKSLNLQKLMEFVLQFWLVGRALLTTCRALVVESGDRELTDQISSTFAIASGTKNPG